MIYLENEKMTFEQASQELERIVRQMESNDITLEESMRLYEKSFTLIEYCYKELENGRGKIEEINSRIKTIKNSGDVF